ncbi:unnamed protein product [Cylicocyclus nassatus]|uniref:Transforming acidic coiled-coil-containing protein C-terminal domain-containing protein n=1 Tax=Cylicocyclus nassatus TaxID=53992 RepID=A0AA36GPB6_CYLNA|nr:unnamed protein product [Cylicocyclus nassatus]
MIVSSLLSIFNWNSPRRAETEMSAEEEAQPEPQPMAAVIDAEPEKTVEMITAAPPEQVFNTPVSKANVSESDLTRTFTRRAAIPKDISPIPDNSMPSPVPPPPAAAAETPANPNPNPRAESRNVRSSRQKTMTMDPSGTQELRKLFMDARQSGISLDDLEAKMVDLFRTKDAEMNGRLAKVMEQVEHHEKHECRNDEANLMVYRALVAEYQMMIEELTSGAYIHVGRLEEYGYSKNGIGGMGCGANCKASLERDQIKIELDSLHEDYAKLYDSFKRMRATAEEQKQEYAALHEKFVEKVEDIKRLQGKLLRLREDAQNKLEMASKDMADCIRDRDESLVGLKLKVRQLEMELSSSQKELEIKKNECVELRDICNTLMSQVEPGSDVEQ